MTSQTHDPPALDALTAGARAAGGKGPRRSTCGIPPIAARSTCASPGRDVVLRRHADRPAGAGEAVRLRPAARSRALCPGDPGGACRHHGGGCAVHGGRDAWRATGAWPRPGLPHQCGRCRHRRRRSIRCVSSAKPRGGFGPICWSVAGWRPGSRAPCSTISWRSARSATSRVARCSAWPRRGVLPDGGGHGDRGDWHERPFPGDRATPSRRRRWRLARWSGSASPSGGRVHARHHAAARRPPTRAAG